MPGKRNRGGARGKARAGAVWSADGEEGYIVEKIVDKRVNQGVVEYLVKWWNWPDSTNTWEKEDTLLKDCPNIVMEYEAERSGMKSTDVMSVVPKDGGKELDFEYESLLRKRCEQGRVQYLVKWKNYGAGFNSWEDEEDIMKASPSPNLIEEFEEKRAKLLASREQRQKRAATGQKLTVKKGAGSIVRRKQVVTRANHRDYKNQENEAESSETDDEPAPSVHPQAQKNNRSAAPSVQLQAQKNKRSAAPASVKRRRMEVAATKEAEETRRDSDEGFAAAEESRPEECGLEGDQGCQLMIEEQSCRTGFDRGLEPISIISATKGINHLMFVVEWNNGLRELVRASEAKRRCPDLVFQFYENSIVWTV